MSPMESVARMLGGRAVLHSVPRTEDDLIELVRKGLPYEALEKLTGILDLSLAEAAEALKLPRRTLARRKHQELLPQLESEKVLRLARLAARAEEVLGAADKAHRWLRTPNRALGGKTPMSMLDVDLGASRVEQLLGRIQFGVYS